MCEGWASSWLQGPVSSRCPARAGCRELEPYAWLVGGCDMGTAIPPDWVGHTFHNGAGFEALDFEVGMTTKYENVFDIVIEDWQGAKAGATSRCCS